MSSHYRWLIIVIAISVAALWISLPDTEKPSFLLRGRDEAQLQQCLRRVDSGDAAVEDCKRFEGEFEFHQGLDIVGGLRVLMEAELPSDSFTVDELRETANSVARRVNGLGLSEATIQVQGSRRVLVELPGVTDPEQAVATIQQTALLEFVDFGGLRQSDVQALEGERIITTEQLRIQDQRRATAEETGDESALANLELTGLTNPSTGQPFQTVMTGSGLKAAVAEFQNTQWLIRFELNADGAAVFGPFTASRLNEPMAIVLDGEVLSAPVIQARLDDGGVISGRFTEEEAKQLALQLRSGSLAIPLRVESAEQVGATLGQESVNKSIRAGIVGVIIVLAFMAIYYRVPGLAADLALLVFILLNLAVFKFLPVTLTLSAITGFLISIGAAVDGNILIFERLKEEVRDGKTLDDSLGAGFERAWNSIRDSNLSTIIICGILFLFGQTPGASIVSGFAITLALGLVLNLFTAVIVTRTFLYVIIINFREPIVQRKWLLGA
jgi:protein-export membrane protein SecD